MRLDRLTYLGLRIPLLLALWIAPAPAWADDYRVDTGDLIHITVFREDDLEQQLRVGTSGNISYPLLGELHIAGKTTREIEKQIHDGLKGRFLKQPKVNVTIKEYRPFYVNGDVEHSGGFPFQPGMTVRKAISLAGGYKDTAVQKAGGYRERVDNTAVEIVRSENPQAPPQPIDLGARVFPGDTVIVTVKEVRPIFVQGEVNAPGNYPYQPGMTVRKAISIAGGFKERASRRRVQRIAVDADSRRPAQVKLEDEIGPGDVVIVNRGLF